MIHKLLLQCNSLMTIWISSGYAKTITLDPIFYLQYVRTCFVSVFLFLSLVLFVCFAGCMKYHPYSEYERQFLVEQSPSNLEGAASSTDLHSTTSSANSSTQSQVGGLIVHESEQDKLMREFFEELDEQGVPTNKDLKSKYCKEVSSTMELMFAVVNIIMTAASLYSNPPP